MTSDALAERLALIVVTDPECGPGRQVLEVVRLALAGGAPSIQLRDKGGSAREMAELARTILEETRRTGALFFVNDRVDVALAVGADGAHIGSDDIPLAAARRIVPPEFILGRSVDRVEEAELAVAEGADYLGAGPVYPTGSKLDAGPVMGVAGIREIRRSAGSLPIVGIGGIDAASAAAVVQAGAAGVAVIGAVMRADDPRRATEELRAAVARR